MSRDPALLAAATRELATAGVARRGARGRSARSRPRACAPASIPSRSSSRRPSARQANDLIDRRTFSWTELFNQFETTLPDEVRITAVRPSVDREKGIVLRVNVVARGVEDVDEFMENLDATGAFPDVRPAEDHFDERRPAA